jgi:hypothetical protein
MASIRRAARRAKEYELLAAVLERQAAWEAALSPWQDPLQPPPVPAWRAWVRRAGGGALALLIAGLAALAMAVLSGIGEPLSEAVRAFVQRQPLWAAALLINHSNRGGRAAGLDQGGLAEKDVGLGKPAAPPLLIGRNIGQGG